MKLKLSLRLRFAGLVIVTLVIVFGAIAVIRVHQNRKALQAQLISSTLTFAKITDSNISNKYQAKGDNDTLIKYVRQVIGLNKNIEGISLIGVDGNILYIDGQSPSLSSNVSVIQHSYYSNGDLKSLTLPENGKYVKEIIYQVSDAYVKAAIKKQLISILTISAIGTVFSAVLVIVAVNQSIIRPIKRLTKQAERISKGDYSDEPMGNMRSDEIGILAHSMDLMQSSLKTNDQKVSQLDDAKSEFMMIASHTLRTPITVIKGSLDALSGDQLNESNRKFIKLAEAGTERLSSFAEDLLIVSNLEVGQQIIKLGPLNVSGIFDITVTYAQTIADDKKLNFSADIFPDLSLEIQANRPYLMNALWNVLDNALKFTPENGHVDLVVKSTNSELVIEVIDDGIGIHHVEIEKVFEKLHRGTSTAQYDYDGSGIGLYVTKEIIEAHNGTINVKSQLGHGSTFTISLPISGNLSSQASQAEVQPAVAPSI